MLKAAAKFALLMFKIEQNAVYILTKLKWHDKINIERGEFMEIEKYVELTNALEIGCKKFRNLHNEFMLNLPSNLLKHALENEEYVFKNNVINFHSYKDVAELNMFLMIYPQNKSFSVNFNVDYLLAPKCLQMPGLSFTDKVATIYKEDGNFKTMLAINKKVESKNNDFDASSVKLFVSFEELNLHTNNKNAKNFCIATNLNNNKKEL